MKPVSESRGLFTVSFPADWRVLEVPRERIGATLHLPAGTSTDNVEALMIVTAPDDDPGCFVWLEALRLQRRITPMDVWVTGGNQLLKGFAEHKTLDEGIEHVGDREVYYNKFTWKSDAATGTLNYSLMEVLVADTTGYLFVGTVPNDPGSIENICRCSQTSWARSHQILHPNEGSGTDSTIGRMHYIARGAKPPAVTMGVESLNSFFDFLR